MESSGSDISRFMKASRKIQAEAARHTYFQSVVARQHKKRLFQIRFKKRMEKKVRENLINSLPARIRDTRKRKALHKLVT